MTSGCGSTVPGTGTFFVGIDIIPGRYRCAEGKGGWWVRFTGSGGERPVGMWPLPPGPAEVDIAADDFAFETRVPSKWELVSRAGPAAPTPRTVADPSLRGELDALVADRGHRLRVRLSPMSVLAVWFGAFFVLGSWWGAAFVPIALTGLLVGFLGDDMRRARALRRRRDRYLTPDDFDAPGRELLIRAQTAIDTVRGSEVNKEGLLDTVDNEVTLPGQEWEIAQVLARQSKLRREQRELLELMEAGNVPEVEAAIEPLREKLEISVQSVTRRIEALERYAERARAADDAYRARRNLEALAERAPEYDDLVADAVRDDLAQAAIDRLTRQGDELVRALRERLGEAGGAAADLPPAPKRPAQERPAQERPARQRPAWEPTAHEHAVGDRPAGDYPATENS
ncbi:MAG TPA: hypothetical protein VF069_29040 [Streptosporangiaceae bacterium]